MVIVILTFARQARENAENRFHAILSRIHRFCRSSLLVDRGCCLWKEDPPHSFFRFSGSFPIFNVICYFSHLDSLVVGNGIFTHVNISDRAPPKSVVVKRRWKRKVYAERFARSGANSSASQSEQDILKHAPFIKNVGRSNLHLPPLSTCARHTRT